MSASASQSVLSDLRAHIARLERGSPHERTSLPFGLPEIDRFLPGGGLKRGAFHEILGGTGAGGGAAAVLFAAGIAARSHGKVLWCMARPDLFAPALSQAGLAAERVVYVECRDEKSLLACFEEALRHPGLGAAIGETSRLSMTASRRLQLAAETSGVIGLAVCRWERKAEAEECRTSSAAVTRWRVSALPSAPLPVPGVGRPRWHLELIRSRAGESAEFVVESCDEQGRLTLSSDMAHGQGTPEYGRGRTSA